MEAINFLTTWINYLFIIVPTGTAAMVTYQAVRKSLSVDSGEIDDANNKIRQTIKGAILIMCLSTTIELIKGFYGLQNYSIPDAKQSGIDQTNFVTQLLKKLGL